MTGKDLAERGLGLLDQGKFQEAKKVFAELVESRTRDGTIAQQAWAIKSLATVERRMGHLDLAMEHAEVAFQLAATIDDPALLAEIQATRGNLRSETGDSKGAIDDLSASLQTLQQAGRLKDALQVLNNLGVCLARLDLKEDALATFREALLLAQSLGDQNVAAQLHNNVGLLYLDSGDFPSAETHFLRDYEYCRSSGDRHALAVAEANLGELHYARNTLDKAATKFAAAEKGFRALGAQPELAQVRKRLRQVDQRLESDE